MKSFLFVLLTGCAVSPVVIEEESRLLLIGNPDTVQEEAPLSPESNSINAVGILAGKPAVEDEDTTSSSSAVFFPDKLDFDKPTRPDPEPVPVPFLYTE